MSLIRPSYKSGYARNASQSANPGLLKGLVNSWVPNFGPTGNTLFDVVGGQHATLTNMDAGADWVMTNKGYGLEFDDGSGQVCNTGNGNLHNDNPINSKSFSFLYLYDVSDVREKMIIAKGGGTTTGYMIYQKYGRLRGKINNSEGYANNIGAVGTWYFATVLFTDSGIIFYINGQDESDVGGGSSYPAGNEHEFAIGGRMISGTPTTTVPLDGKILSVMVHNRMISLHEHRQLYYNHLAPFHTRGLTFAYVAPVGGGTIPPIYMNYARQRQ